MDFPAGSSLSQVSISGCPPPGRGERNQGEIMMTRIAPLLAATFGLLAVTAVSAAPAMTGDSANGPVLTDEKGMTLYIFDNDTGGISSCYDACATNWPPLMAPEGAEAEGDYGVSERTDGSYQWTYKGMPLYTWIKDAKPGDVTGDGVKGVWHIAKP
jgi:predicted lipoprotein with Yx(FWY)xxD motif